MLNINSKTKYLLLIGILLITTILWLFTKISIENTNVLTNPLENLAQLLGLLAVNFFAINFILATRFYFIESLFGGLDKMYKFHKMIARIAFTLAWAHPLFILMDRFRGIESIQRYFLPGNSDRLNFGIFALYVMTLLVLLSLTKFLPYHIWKNSHRLMVIVMVFVLIHLINPTGTLSSNFLLYIWTLGFIAISILCWIYIEFLYKRIGPVFYYKLSKISNLGEVNELYFEPQNKPMIYSAGQFTFLSFLKNKSITQELHPYTISSNPHEYYLRISAKNLGDYSSTLSNAKEGDIVKLIGPYGHFTRDRLINNKKQIWIAGGIGVTPFLSMLAAEKDEPSGNNIHFYYSTKTLEDSVYRAEIQKDAENFPDLTIKFNTDSEDGYLSAKKIVEDINYDIKDAYVLICGPTQMMYALRKQFIELGLNSKQIIFEDFALKPV